MNKIVEGIKNKIDFRGKIINRPCPRHPRDQECVMCDGTGMIYCATLVDSMQTSQAIYSSRKELGLFTLDDIEIDKKVVAWVLLNSQAYNLAKAIADKKPIKIILDKDK